MRRNVTALIGRAAAAGLIAAAIGFTVPLSAGQSATAFEVASVKRNASGDDGVRIRIDPGGRFTATNMPLRFLITFIYDLQSVQLVGGPDWLTTDRFDFTATAAREVRPPEMKLMIRALLADRFGLVVHEETRDMPVYALIVARSDGRLGPKLAAASNPCAAPFAGRAST